MSKKAIIVIFFLFIAFAGVLIYAIVTHSQLSDSKHTLSSVREQLSITNAELDTTKSQLADTNDKLTGAQDELTSTRTELSNTQNELNNTKTELSSTVTELANVKDQFTSTQHELEDVYMDLTTTQNELERVTEELTNTQDELASTKYALSSAQTGSTSLQNTLTGTQKQLATARDTLKGLGITVLESKICFDVALVDNPNATNPSWSQLVNFLAQDKTENNTYIEDVYDCSQFSRDVHNHAEAAGIRAAEVQVRFSNDTVGHALNAFLTTDYGLVYVDCTGTPDKITHIKAGKELRAVEPYHITMANIADDTWWDSLNLYGYVSNSSGAHCVTSSIIIYW